MDDIRYLGVIQAKVSPVKQVIMEQANGNLPAFLCLFTYQLCSFSFLWKSQPILKVFPWTGKNDYMILTDSNSIAIGGG